MLVYALLDSKEGIPLIVFEKDLGVSNNWFGYQFQHYWLIFLTLFRTNIYTYIYIFQYLCSDVYCVYHWCFMVSNNFKNHCNKTLNNILSTSNRIFYKQMKIERNTWRRNLTLTANPAISTGNFLPAIQPS